MPFEMCTCPLNHQRRIHSVAFIVLLAVAFTASAAETTNASSTNRLTVADLLRRVTQYNESIQMKMLDAEISKKTGEAERGVFEPQVVGSVERIDSRRPNNTQQLLNQGFAPTAVLVERNTLYNGGLEFLIPTGAKLRAGYTMRDLRNNLQNRGEEYEAFVGASLVQPLLKGFGTAATMARIRLAALAYDIAYQEYRRQLMVTVSQAESAYWDLYLTQEQSRISVESVALAEKIFNDNRARSDVGKSSELEVLQAEAGLALRRSRLNEARFKVYDFGNRLRAYFSDASFTTNAPIEVIDEPVVVPAPVSLADSFQQAFTQNPDYLIRRTQLAQEQIRVRYAKNQRLPQLDLRGSYGFNGLGQSEGDAMADFSEQDFPAWSVGVEFRIPIAGGIREGKEYEAAKLSRQRMMIGVQEAEVQIANLLDAVVLKVRTYRENVAGYQDVVSFHEKLVQSQLANLEVGRIDSRTVLETEEKLFEAKIAVVENLVLYRKALLELELIRGSVLRSRELEISKKQLHARTAELLAQGKWSESQLQAYQNRIFREFQQRTANDR